MSPITRTSPCQPMTERSRSKFCSADIKDVLKKIIFSTIWILSKSLQIISISNVKRTLAFCSEAAPPEVGVKSESAPARLLRRGGVSWAGGSSAGAKQAPSWLPTSGSSARWLSPCRFKDLLPHLEPFPTARESLGYFLISLTEHAVPSCTAGLAPEE